MLLEIRKKHVKHTVLTGSRNHVELGIKAVLRQRFSVYFWSVGFCFDWSWFTWFQMAAV